MGTVRILVVAAATALLTLACSGTPQPLGSGISLPVTSPSLPRLTTRGPEGKFFQLETGEAFTAIEATDFNLYDRFLKGEDIRPVLEQRAHPWDDGRSGFNMLRVWTAYDVCPDGVRAGRSCQPIGRLVPREHSDFYARLPEFLTLVSTYGFYVELTAFTGRWEVTLPTESEKDQHWAGLVATVQSATNVILELVNEYNHPANKGLPVMRFDQPPAPLLASHGSGIAGSAPLQPYWTHGTYRPGTGSRWMWKAVHDGMEKVADMAGIPVLVNEMTRFPDQDQSLEHAYDVARGCALLLAGCAFHSVSGKASALWSGQELALAQAWVTGARSMPLGCQAGRYVRRTNFEQSGILRAYERAGVGPGCIAMIRQ